MTSIIPFTPENSRFIKSLNEEWLRRYFSVEPRDVMQLSEPQTEILDKGGMIYYALHNHEIVGTVTLMRVDTETLELSKMAVTESMQGKGIGKLMMQHCLEVARGNQIKKLILFSNTKLEAAIAMYRKYGFKEVTLDPTQYKRANIKMELVL